MIYTRSLIYIGSDHAGFNLKEKLKKYLYKKYKINDISPKLIKNDDYPDYASKLCKKIIKTKAKGILLCGTGQGMAIAANKIKGIRAALCYNKQAAKQSREHIDANILVLPGKIKENNAKNITKTFLETKFSNKIKHIRRINKIKQLEIKQLKKKK